MVRTESDNIRRRKDAPCVLYHTILTGRGSVPYNIVIREEMLVHIAYIHHRHRQLCRSLGGGTYVAVQIIMIVPHAQTVAPPEETTITVTTVTPQETITYHKCGSISLTCPDECPNKTWTDVANKKYQVKCAYATCEYQCNKGYYGSGQSCTRCPSSSSSIVYGTTAANGATAITECYLPSGTIFSDGTGSGTYAGDCYYTN